jgi:hypothetical protein
MQARKPLIFIIGLAAAVTLTASEVAFARQKKRHTVRVESPTVAHDYDGTPIIMQGFRRTRPAVGQPVRQADRPVRIPRGSSTYISPPMPSPNSPNSPPSAVLLQTPRPAVVPPPSRPSFSDRVTNCIHSYPLNAGIGNNPTDQQAYIRQCAN